MVYLCGHTRVMLPWYHTSSSASFTCITAIATRTENSGLRSLYISVPPEYGCFLSVGLSVSYHHIFSNRPPVEVQRLRRPLLGSHAERGVWGQRVMGHGSQRRVVEKGRTEQLHQPIIHMQAQV
jgi:hypothetical protein